MFALGTVGFGEVMPLPVVFGAAPPAAGALGLPGAVAPGLPPAPPVCANAAVVISSADTIATGTNVLADVLRLLLALRNFARSILVKVQFVEREDCSGQSRGSDVWRERTEAHLNSGNIRSARRRNSGAETGVYSFVREREGDRRVMSRWLGGGGNLDQFRVSARPYAQCSIIGCEAPSAPRQVSRSTVVTGLVGSLALSPLAWAQGSATRRRVQRLPAANPPHDGKVPGAGDPIRVIGIGESSVSGVGLSRGDETVTAVTARALARHTGRPAAWRACGLSGATVRDALQRLVPSIAPEPADLMIVAFGVNDATSYRSPSAFADDLTELVTTARDRVGDAAVVIGGVAPLLAFPALPWPLRSILGWRSTALQAAADRLADRLPRLVVERFSAPLSADLFAPDGVHPNSRAHSIWGEKIAALALPLVA